LSKEELDVCVGVLKKKAAIDLKKDKKLIVSITYNGGKLLGKKSLEEEFLEKHFPVESSGLKPEEKFAFENLIKRKDILKEEVVKIREVELTNVGNKIIKKGISNEKFIDRLTPGLLKMGKWRKKNFRAYDVEINVPKAYYGKRHFVNDAISYVKKIWLEMGFTEMTGQLVDSSFWNFDALFTSQDHPVRDLQDTFFIKDIKSELKDKAIVERVKKTHEDGWTTGSMGWKYDWDVNEARKNVLRTHTTILSVKEISKLKKEDLPAKFFSVGKCSFFNLDISLTLKIVVCVLRTFFLASLTSQSYFHPILPVVHPSSCVFLTLSTIALSFNSLLISLIKKVSCKSRTG
jgi:phenylalanyl-tRNA synthetase alpha chain